MQDNFDIRVVLDFSGGSHDSCLVSESIAIVERLLHASERSDLDSLTAEFRREIPIVAIDAAKYRIKKLAGHSLILTKAESGSIILTGLVGGLAVWVLSATLGESLKQAWVESGLHQRIKDSLLKKRHAKVLSLERQIEDRLPRRLKRIRYSSTVTVSVRGNNTNYPSELYIKIEATHVTLSTPSLDDVLKDEHKTLIISSEHLGHVEF